MRLGQRLGHLQERIATRLPHSLYKCLQPRRKQAAPIHKERIPHGYNLCQGVSLHDHCMPYRLSDDRLQELNDDSRDVRIIAVE